MKSVHITSLARINQIGFLISEELSRRSTFFNTTTSAMANGERSSNFNVYRQLGKGGNQFAESFAQLYGDSNVITVQDDVLIKLPCVRSSCLNVD